MKKSEIEEVRHLAEQPCRVCNAHLPLTCFGKGNNPRGLDSRCKSCRKSLYKADRIQILAKKKEEYWSGGKEKELLRDSTLEGYLRRLDNIQVRGRKRNLGVEVLMSLWEAQKGLCALSGTPMTHITGRGRVDTNISIDRIDSSRGYEPSNVQLVCLRVNLLKGDLPFEDLLEWCKRITEWQKTK